MLLLEPNVKRPVSKNLKVYLSHQSHCILICVKDKKKKKGSQKIKTTEQMVRGEK